ncbi:MAG TPA: LUD domain-containing protein [Acidimicrobiia bacterium]|jgi:L-lactate dehydrogenase complex protein LldG
MVSEVRDDRLARFAAALRANSAVVLGPVDWEGAAEAAAALAGERAAGAAIAVATGDPVLARLRFTARLEDAGAKVLLPTDPAWEDLLPSAGAGVTGAAFGVAATGTVAVPCGVGSPRGVSLVPPAHICLVRASDVVEDLSEALGLLSSMPSAVAWISGPSRSADLEMTLTLGVHGPASVDIVVVDDSD